MTAISERLSSRRIAPGEKLPSIRGMAKTMRVSPSTVVEAYDRLAGQGLIRARPGSGFYALGTAPVSAAPEPRRERAVDPFWVSRQSLDAEAGVLRPGCGWLPADWMPTETIRRAMRGLARADAETLCDYGASRGSLSLRRLLARQFSGEGLDVGPDAILLTGSGTQAIDLVCRQTLRPGDAVLVDDPCYFNFPAILATHGVRLVGVPRTPLGPDVERFAEALAAHRPKLYLTNSAIHNPTGGTLAPAIAHRILLAAAQHDCLIVEDDIFADFEPEPSPRLASLDGLARVIRIGSFSKSLSASLRCGYVAGQPSWIEELTDLQVASSFGGPSPVAAEIVLRALSEGGYRKHMAALRERLARQRREVGSALRRFGILPWTEPRGGPFLWCSLPDGRDAGALAEAALAQDMVLAPGNVFSVDRTAMGMMRFNVAQMDREAVERLGALLES
ncbi:MAG: GntR family transcriptional regulator [Mesorhizobium amorphae]|nr:MAG: GntR family transcriptional regulator [Mesorhizobium amorphae]